MKRIYVNEKWCLGCHLCEYECAFAATGLSDMAKALKGKVIHPKIKVEDGTGIHFAVNLPSLQPTRSASRAVYPAPSRKGRTGSSASTKTSVSAA